jgi:SAM-dependent methyltransferase
MQAHAMRETTPEQLERLRAWRDLLAPPAGDAVRESEHLAEYLRDVFVDLLGYRSEVGSPQAHSYARERHNPVDGKYADAVLGRFGGDRPQTVVVIEGKGPRDPLDRPFAGRRRSAVEQAYGYAINLRCDWIVVTSMRETRLYSKRADQRSFESFATDQLAEGGAMLRRFIFLLGADRVLRPDGSCHLDELFETSERQGRRITSEFYQQYRDVRLQVLEGVLQHNCAVPPTDALSNVQKLIDRSLFVAFCEDRSLLPEHSLAKALDFSDPYRPRPKWDNLKGLFLAVDRGSAPLNIPLYNGGLFAPDEALDSLVIPDDVIENLRVFGSYDFRPPSDAWSAVEDSEPEAAAAVDVEILGHIFEQSIEDLERLRAELASGRPATQASARVRQGRGISRRNREGSFYTPSFATSYMVREALQPVLAERFEAVRLRVLDAALVAAEAQTLKGRRRRMDRSFAVLDDPRVFDAAAMTASQSAVLTNFWEAWLEELRTVRILDLACGSGAFLIEAFDQMTVEYRAANGRLAELTGQPSLFDADTTLLRNNLFGMDLNSEAIEIARLSIWIKTAKRGRPLTHLDDRILQGNSVVERPDLDPLARDPRVAFPEVFGKPDGGFDVIVGNPPYVRDELLGPYKPYFKDRYSTFHGGADLYVYFFERAVQLLRPGGYLSYVTPNKWLRASYAEALRGYMAEEAWPVRLVDFGHAREFFPDADVSPCIVVARRPPATLEPVPPVVACAIPRDQLRIDDLSNQLALEGFEVPRADLTPAIWRIEHPRSMDLLRKLERSGRRLEDYVGARPAYGVKTGYNDAFLINDGERADLIRADIGSADVIKPYLRGKDIGRWASAERTGWMIFARRGIEIDRYPAVRDHLAHQRARLEPRPPGHRGDWGGRKAGSYQWYELQDSVDYWRQLEGPKIIFQDIAWSPRFCLDEEGRYLNNTAYFIPSDDRYLLAVLNSPVFWWYAWRTAQHGKDEALRLFGEFMAEVPIPIPSDEIRSAIAEDAAGLASIRVEQMRRRAELCSWLRVQFDIEEPERVLRSGEFGGTETFARAVTRARGRSRPLSALGLATLMDEHRSFSVRSEEVKQHAARLERSVAQRVYDSFALTADDVRELRRTAPPRTPVLKLDEGHQATGPDRDGGDSFDG